MRRSFSGKEPIIDACGKSYTAITKEFDVAKRTMTLL